MKYIVSRPHQGDKWYAQGEMREAKEADVAHLVTSGVLKAAPPEAKSESVVQQSAPENKAGAPVENTAQKPVAGGTDANSQDKSKG